MQSALRFLQAQEVMRQQCAVRRRGLLVGANPTRQLSLQPVAAEARMEAMKCVKPLVPKARWKKAGQRASRP